MRYTYELPLHTMKYHFVFCTVAGLWIGICTRSPGQIGVCAPSGHKQDTSRFRPAPDTTATQASATESGFWQSLHFSGGQMTLPFKIRPKKENGTFRLTTDVTLGAYFGVTKRLSTKREYFLTVPISTGLTFININSDNTTLDRSAESADVVPGLSWCTGLILQMEKYNLGLMFGKDYASEVGNQWMYHGKLWWSFGIGFTFLQ